MSTCSDPTTVPRYRLSLVRETESPYTRDLLDHSDAVANWLWREVYHDVAQETMSAVFVDCRNRLVGYQVSSRSTRLHWKTRLANLRSEFFRFPPEK